MSTPPFNLQPPMTPEARVFHVVVVSGGAEPDVRVAQHLGVVDLVIAADSGLSHAALLGLSVTTAIGDFDSVSAEVLSQAEARGVEIVPYPVNKDATDLELALELAVTRGATHITMVSGGPGERLDHFLGEISVLTASFLSACQVVGFFGDTKVSVIRPPVALTVFGSPSDLITLLPVTPEATGVTTTGLQYPLSNATLHAWRTRGVSNVLLEESAVVSLTEGVLLCVQPDALGSRS
jgi:thiamine pyrophosphokinase